MADHHVSPGKKQWTWGCGDFGKRWDRNLTDEDGPYIELMTGVFTDNQPDFTWLKPFEEKVFKQYFMPYKAVGDVKNATVEAAVNFTVSDGRAEIVVYATSPRKEAEIVITRNGEVVFRDTADLDPVHTYQGIAKLNGGREQEYTVSVRSREGKELVSFTPLERDIPKLPEPAKAAKEPQEIVTVEELYLTGQHIEQYRHATCLPDKYYLEGLKRDPGDIRTNIAYGSLLLSRGLFEECEPYFRRAVRRATWKNPNPYDSEGYYKLGLSLFYQKKYESAYDAFYKATWSSEQQEMSFYYLAAIACGKEEYENALYLIEKGLVKNWHNVKARGIKAVILRMLDRREAACSWIKENLQIDPFDYVSRWEALDYLEGEALEKEKRVLSTCLRGNAEAYLRLARDYAECGFYAEAEKILCACPAEAALNEYYKAYYMKQSGKSDTEVAQQYLLAEAQDSYCCFPNELEDIAVLTDCGAVVQHAAFSWYYLGNLYYDKKQYEKAAVCWETCVKNNDRFPTAYRNLSLAYYNHLDRKAEARAVMERALELDTGDARIFFELDQLYKKLGVSVKERLAHYEAYKETALERDDAFIEYVTLQNLAGNYEEAYALLQSRKLHPWEGGEGKAAAQYIAALVEMAKEKLRRKEYAQAKELLQRALVYPENLGEGKLEGCRDNNIYYYLGLTEELLGEAEEAGKCFRQALEGSNEVAGMMYYNDQPADMILYQGLACYKLGLQKDGNRMMYRLIDFGEQHVCDEVKIDYFAVSLPDLMIYEEDFTRKNKAHCNYVMGLGNLGLGKKDEAVKFFEETLHIDPFHLNCRILLGELKRQQ